MLNSMNKTYLLYTNYKRDHTTMSSEKCRASELGTYMFVNERERERPIQREFHGSCLLNQTNYTRFFHWHQVPTGLYVVYIDICFDFRFFQMEKSMMYASYAQWCWPNLLIIFCWNCTRGKIKYRVVKISKSNRKKMLVSSVTLNK